MDSQPSNTTEYAFEREPSPKRFVAFLNGQRIAEQIVGEGQSLSDALRGLLQQTSSIDSIGITELSFRAGYLVAVWDSRYAHQHRGVR